MIPTKADRFSQVPRGSGNPDFAREYRKEQQRIGEPHPPCVKCTDDVICACARDSFECRAFEAYVRNPERAKRFYLRLGEDY